MNLHQTAFENESHLKQMRIYIPDFNTVKREN